MNPDESKIQFKTLHSNHLKFKINNQTKTFHYPKKPLKLSIFSPLHITKVTQNNPYPKKYEYESQQAANYHVHKLF